MLDRMGNTMMVGNQTLEEVAISYLGAERDRDGLGARWVSNEQGVGWFAPTRSLIELGRSLLQCEGDRVRRVAFNAWLSDSDSQIVGAELLKPSSGDAAGSAFERTLRSLSPTLEGPVMVGRYERDPLGVPGLRRWRLELWLGDGIPLAVGFGESSRAAFESLVESMSATETAEVDS